jgi:hypothetical protein
MYSLPLNVPGVPAFGREPFQHSIKTLVEGVAYDDLYTMNTQSGTQWDGFRHACRLTFAPGVGLIKSAVCPHTHQHVL